jgi:ribosomal protein S14
MTAPARVYLEADVKCYHCGHVSGVVRVDRGVKNAPAMFKPHGSDAEIRIDPRARPRCLRCGGPTLFEEFELRREYPKVDFLEDRPRRGRPPKRLLEQRGVA